ncbi:cadherin EGF LAG seven-pass G-type receptor 2-like [Belonocnema kinseyi]|uniref:cadherin EGF LAG seven-pass G-type receptor 2-like n=1 Tax=Belonocnema kinseyi TaxID=2817044 RepID=UPI00143D5CF7|nr:cadherin EGF LAG seven-pass G-type receptor 2-like [Belonocnema kinseyi]
MDDLKILSVTLSSEVTFHFFGNSQDGDKIREALNRLVQRRRLNEITLESTHFTFQQKPSLRLQTLRLNQVNEHVVRLGDQFMLTCVAQGSYNINFTWYKDNMLINMSKATREIWYRHLPNDGSDMHTSLLTIEKATLLDAGQYTCQVVDWEMQQCKSIYIDVKGESDVKVVPMSATLEKGGNIELMCITPNMRSMDIGFGWTKNRALLKLELGSEVWEDLYPAGSILKITNAQKSAIYTCNMALRSMSVRVEVVNRTLIPLCPKDKSWGLEWPETGPGTEALLECPRHFIGRHASRPCSMKDATSAKWESPDFSDCLYEPLIFPYDKFRSLTLGYQNTSGSETAIELWELLRNRTSSFYPGEGDRILNILAEIELYQYNIDETRDLGNSAEESIRILNRILEEDRAIYNQQKSHLLKQLAQRSLSHWTQQSVDAHKHLSMSSLILDMQTLQVRNNYGIMQVPSDNYVYPHWYHDKITIRSQRKQSVSNSNFSITGSVIVFRNLARLMPTIYKKELEDGSELKYRIDSRVVLVAASNHFPKEKDDIWVDLRIRHSNNQSAVWNISCGVLDNLGSWDLNACTATPFLQERTVQCICPSTGTFAAFLTSRTVKVVLTKSERTPFIVIFGCGSCLLQCLLSSLIIGLFWWNNRTWINFLKLQCCGAIIAAMGMFIYAAYNNLPESSWTIVAVSLETFLLVAMTAPISQVLIIYAELTNIRPGHHLQPTVIAVITGVPILSVLATELIHKSAGWRHESWWLIFGSGVYNIFITCTAMMLLIFGLLYGGVLLRSRALVKGRFVKKKSIEARLHMVHRTTVIICGIIAMEASSVFYINSTSIIVHYVFALSSALLGFIIFMMYVITSELKCLVSRCKLRHKGGIEEECISDQINVCSKIRPDVENDMAPTHILTKAYMESRGIAAGSIDMREYMNEEIISYPKSAVPVKSRFLPEVRVDHSDNINLETYSTSPRKYQETKFDSSISSRNSITPYIPETYSVIESKNFRDFGKFGVPHELTSQVSLPPRCVTPDCTTVLCNVDVESCTGMNSMPDVTLAVNSEVELLNSVNSTDIVNNKKEHVSVIPDIANTMERKQPDGEEKIGKLKLANSDGTTTGMLDRISHDLDYLLNRKQEET